MGLFTGIEQAKVSEGGNYLKPGNFLLEILGIKTGKTRGGRAFFVVECKVLESDNLQQPAGITVSWMVMLDQDMALPNIKKFAAAVTGSAIDEIDEAGIEYLVSDKQPLKGKKVGAQATNIKTKRDTDFTKVEWFLPGN